MPEPTYYGLVNVNELGKVRINFDDNRGEIAYYCKDCKKLVEAIRLPPVGKREYIFECSICHGQNIAWGTTASLQEHYTRKKYS